MDECKSNQSSSNASPLVQQQFHQTNINNYFLYDDNFIINDNDNYHHNHISHHHNNNTGRLSKVTEENSQNNNSSIRDDETQNDDDSLNDNNNNQYNHNRIDIEDHQEDEENEEEISVRLLYPTTNTNNMRNYHQLHQHHRHNNTPHGNEEDQNIIFNTVPAPAPAPAPTPTPTPYHDIHDTTFIPERIRLLLDRFAANGYIISNAPPPANQSIIDKIPEIIVDKKFIYDNYNNNDEMEFECSICKLPIEIQQKIKLLPCSHYFHSRCITTWLQIHASCPLCRRRLNTNMVNNTNGITDTMRMEDGQTRAMMARLRDLRQRRRSRRTLRNYNSNTSTSGNHTPRPNNGSNRRSINNNSSNNNNGHIQHAATQLFHG